MDLTLKKEMLSQIKEWAEINSCSTNYSGLLQMKEVLKTAFRPLHAELEEVFHPQITLFNNAGDEIKQPSAPTLHLSKRKEKSRRVLLLGHYDTVYPENSPFQKVKQDGKYLYGPGVADMKGGLSILLQTLLAFETTEIAKTIGWEILLNPDEEIGSPASLPTILTVAKKCQLGLVFEPALADGSLVSTRKGSLTLLIRCYGLSAHAGRDFFAGKSAIAALAKLTTVLHSWNTKEIIWNVGTIHGGEAANVVPAFAFLRLNIRGDDLSLCQNKITTLMHSIQEEEGVRFELTVLSARPPKRGDKRLLSYTNLPLGSSGGATDGSNLEAAGLPTIDSLGCVGGALHSPEEYLEIESLEARTTLNLKLLHAFAKGEI